MNYILTIILTVITTLVFNQVSPPKVWDNPGNSFGATNFPTSLDTLTNPAGTDSVATVSHSAQHSNANDALEAIEAKLGIGASTPVANTLFAGSGAGTSLFTTHATATQFYAVNLFATGSSTLQNFTFLNATGTAATTTSLFSTTASTTNLFGTSLSGFGLSTCSGANFLQWTGGIFGCTSPTPSTLNGAATSTPSIAQSMRGATTTAVTTGEKLFIWGTCGVNSSGRIGLYIKPTGSATTTIAAAAGPNATSMNTLFGIYTSGATENVEIYFGSDPVAGDGNYIDCLYPAFMYLRG